MSFAPIVAIALLLAQVDTGVPPQKTPEQELAEVKADFEQEFATLPKVEARPIREIVSVSVVEGMLQVHPLLNVSEQTVHAPAKEWPGLLSLQVGSPQRPVLIMKHVAFLPNGVTMTHVSLIGEQLNISRDTETAAGMQSVSVIQSAPRPDDEDRIHVNISRAGGNPNLPPTQKLSAISFGELHQRHGAEMREFVAPILRDLGAETAMRFNSPDAAWQVLGGDVPVNASLNTKLDALLIQLDAESPAARTAAEEELTALGAPAAAALAQRDLNVLPPDVRATLEAFIRSTHTVSPDVVQSLQSDTTFLLDTLLLDEPALRQAALKRLNESLNTRIELPETMTPQQRTAEVEVLRGKYVTAAKQYGQ